MTCEQLQELIHAYFDGELDPLRNLETEGHLSECEACQSNHQEYSNVRALVQGGAQYFRVPEPLKKRIEKTRLSLALDCATL